MSQHKSLKIYKFKHKKSVNKKVDRIKRLLEEGKVTKENLKVFGLPKEKIVRIKSTKRKDKEEELKTTAITDKLALLRESYEQRSKDKEKK